MSVHIGWCRVRCDCVGFMCVRYVWTRIKFNEMRQISSNRRKIDAGRRCFIDAGGEELIFSCFSGVTRIVCYIFK